MAKLDLKEYKHVAIDLGTSRSRIYIDGLGIVFDEPSLIKIETNSHKILGFGEIAKNAIGKTSKRTRVIPVLKNGVLTSMDYLKQFLKYALSKYEDKIKKFYVTLACPIGVTDMERKGLVTSIKNLGAAYVHIEEDAKLALYGVGKDVYQNSGLLILDIGAGKSSCAVIINGEVIASRWSKSAGISIDIEIFKYLRNKKNISVGLSTCEIVKNSVGSVLKSKTPATIKIYGNDVTSGMPKEVIVDSNELLKITQSVFGNLTILVTGVLEESPSELASDVIKNGVIITGGVSQMSGTKFFFENFFEIPAMVPKNAANAVINGAIEHKAKTIEIYNNQFLKEDYAY